MRERQGGDGSGQPALSEVYIHSIPLTLIEHVNIYIVLSARDPGVKKRDMIPALSEIICHQGR